MSISPGVEIGAAKQCCQVENVKYQQLKKEKSANISMLENQHKSALFFHIVYFDL